MTNKKPIVIPDGPTWFCDIDDTLVIWGKPDHPEAIAITMDWGNGIPCVERLVPHKTHIDMLKKAKFRGHVVVVWSAGGSAWAHAVVKALGLEEYVDLVVSKPNWFIDDLPASAFLPEYSRIYVNDYDKKVKLPPNPYRNSDEDPDFDP